jgi:hypothetical protein
LEAPKFFLWYAGLLLDRPARLSSSFWYLELKEEPDEKEADGVVGGAASLEGVAAALFHEKPLLPGPNSTSLLFRVVMLLTSVFFLTILILWLFCLRPE